MNLNMLQTRAGTTHEDREHARATQQTHARARARARKEPTSARSSAHGTKQCAHERARNQTMRAQACDKTKARTRKTDGGTEPTRARAHTGKHKGRASKQTVRREKHKAQGTSKTKHCTWIWEHEVVYHIIYLLYYHFKLYSIHGPLKEYKKTITRSDY